MHIKILFPVILLFFFLRSDGGIAAAHAQKHKPASPFVCDMSALTPAERETHRETAQKIFQSVQQVKALRNGYAIRLSTDSSMLTAIAQFIEKERLCCPFMKFTVEVGEERGPIWVTISGRKGAKEFIREEFNFDALVK